jgi:hypothetical protein
MWFQNFYRRLSPAYVSRQTADLGSRELNVLRIYSNQVTLGYEYIGAEWPLRVSFFHLGNKRFDTAEISVNRGKYAYAGIFRLSDSGKSTRLVPTGEYSVMKIRGRGAKTIPIVPNAGLLRRLPLGRNATADAIDRLAGSVVRDGRINCDDYYRRRAGQRISAELENIGSNPALINLFGIDR